jgi:2-amino-4-hydroxy-6-hydroxymethyldihydropteridine diphosphokinase
MKKTIKNNSKLVWYFGENYPYSKININTKQYNKQHINKTYTQQNSHKIIIGIGGNLPKTKLYFKLLFLSLLKDSRFSIIRSSPILQNPAFGYIKQKDFLNSIIYLKTKLSPKQALRVFLKLELRYKRIRSFANAPRSLDIDIIFYIKANKTKTSKINTQMLTIPHPCYKHRQSVLLPLTYCFGLNSNIFRN